jgi:NifU-like protein
MEEYTYKIRHFSQNPLNYGEISEDEAKADGGELFVYEHGARSKGEAVTWYWVIDPQAKTIIRARFKAFGTYAARAVYDMMCVLLRTKKIEEIEQTIGYAALERFLRDNPAEEALPQKDRHLIHFAIDGVKDAARAYLRAQPKPADTIVCKCAHVSLGTIEEAIRLHDLKSVEEITAYTKAGAFCKSCVSEGSGFEEREIYLDEILEYVRKEMEEEAKAAALPDTPFEQLDLPQKIAYVNKIIDDKIRQFLIMDGGDMEILDIKQNGENIDIYIRYLGACSGCASSATGRFSPLKIR